MGECEVFGCENTVTQGQDVCDECENAGVIGVEYFQDTVNQYIEEGYDKEKALAFAAEDAINVVEDRET